MSAGFESYLDKYVEVVVRVGLNLQAGQRLVIGVPMFGIDGTPMEAYPLVREIAAAAYQAGAPYVAVNWDDEELHRIRVQHAPLKSMNEFATWNMWPTSPRKKCLPCRTKIALTAW